MCPTKSRLGSPLVRFALAAGLGLAGLPPTASASERLPQSASSEVVSEIVLHGSYSLSEEELLALAQVRVGDRLGPSTLGEVEQRLMRSGRFDWVEVRKRYRSMTRLDRVVLVISVKQKVPVKKKFLFFPILSLSDEYGFTFGLRTTAIDLLGMNEHLSFPLSWGGEKQAAVEGQFDVDAFFADQALISGGVLSRENPHFEVDDRRLGAQGGLRKRWGRFELNLHAGYSDVDFGLVHEDFTSYGFNMALDTRQDINLPGNAVYAGLGWEFVDILGKAPSFHRYTFDLRGYKRVFGHATLAGQFLYQGADSRLPDYQRPFLGGAATLRGHPAGEFIGDVLTLTSVELRYPLTSPLRIYKAGFTVFLDSGAVYDHGRSLRSADFKHGIGGGLFLFVLGLGLKVEVAHDFDDSVRVHFSTRFRF